MPYHKKTNKKSESKTNAKNQIDHGDGDGGELSNVTKETQKTAKIKHATSKVKDPKDCGDIRPGKGMMDKIMEDALELDWKIVEHGKRRSKGHVARRTAVSETNVERPTVSSKTINCNVKDNPEEWPPLKSFVTHNKGKQMSIEVEKDDKDTVKNLQKCSDGMPSSAIYANYGPDEWPPLAFSFPPNKDKQKNSLEVKGKTKDTVINLQKFNDEIPSSARSKRGRSIVGTLQIRPQKEQNINSTNKKITISTNKDLDKNPLASDSKSAIRNTGNRVDFSVVSANREEAPKTGKYRGIGPKQNSENSIKQKFVRKPLKASLVQRVTSLPPSNNRLEHLDAIPGTSRNSRICTKGSKLLELFASVRNERLPTASMEEEKNDNDGKKIDEKTKNQGKFRKPSMPPLSMSADRRDELSVLPSSSRNLRTSAREKPILETAADAKNNSITMTLRRKSTTRQMQCVAMDCEMVGVGFRGQESIVARVSIVSEDGLVLLDKYVKPCRPVTDYRTFVSGIRPKDIAFGEDFAAVRREVQQLLKGKILIGHAIQNDLRAMYLEHPRADIRDTAFYRPFSQYAQGGIPSLKLLSNAILKRKIQIGEHSSIEDARAAMNIYQNSAVEWEEHLQNKKYGC